MPLPNYRFWYGYLSLLLERMALGQEIFEDGKTTDYDVKLINMTCYTFMRAKIFEVDSKVTMLLQLTKNTVHDTKLPFPIVFIETKFKMAGSTFLGMLLIEDPDVYYHWKIPVTPGHQKFLDNQPLGHDITIISFHTEDGESYAISKGYLFRKSTGKEDKATMLPEHTSNAMKLLVMNFLDFLHEPDVEWVESKRIKYVRDQFKKRKIRLPKSTTVQVKGKLKRYIQELKKGKAFTYSHRFWVRGHWRHFRSKFYKQMRGKKKWIPPYIKGKGILIEKRYHLVEN